jgi:hypothetical protein
LFLFWCKCIIYRKWLKYPLSSETRGRQLHHTDSLQPQWYSMTTAMSGHNKQDNLYIIAHKACYQWWRKPERSVSNSTDAIPITDGTQDPQKRWILCYASQHAQKWHSTPWAYFNKTFMYLSDACHIVTVCHLAMKTVWLLHWLMAWTEVFLA